MTDERGPGHGMTVLVVDDDAVNRKLARLVLEELDFTVAVAATAAAAFAAAASPPDAILLDLRLPDLDGSEVARRLRADPALGRCAILALSASTATADRERALAAGCDAFLTKPPDTRALPRAVADHIARRRRLEDQ